MVLYRNIKQLVLKLISRIISLLLILTVLSVHADIYKWTDEKGLVHITDKAPKTHKYEDIEEQILSRGNIYHGSVESDQKQLLSNFSGTIHQGDPNTTELFFVSFAGDAKQSVFMKEALYTKRLFDRRYQTNNRSVALINNRKTTARHLVASNENLEHILKIMGKKMDKDDILYLYLTSHGSSKHQLSVDFPPHTVKDFGAVEIRRMLDEAGIKWRVIVVSACFSGGFIGPLKTNYSVIATASDATHKSFGCADDREFTYYGEAIFLRQMSRGVGIMNALDGARDIVQEMEKLQGYSHANPQFWIGSQAAAKLKKLEIEINLETVIN